MGAGVAQVWMRHAPNSDGCGGVSTYRAVAAMRNLVDTRHRVGRSGLPGPADGVATRTNREEPRPWVAVSEVAAIR